MPYPRHNPYDFGAETTDPEARPHKPFIVDGEYPEGAQEKEPYPGAGYKTVVDEHLEEQTRRREVLEAEGGTIGGQWPHYPDRAHPASPEQYQEEQERAEYVRACHGGLPDAPGEAEAVASKPFKGLRG